MNEEEKTEYKISKIMLGVGAVFLVISITLLVFFFKEVKECAYSASAGIISSIFMPFVKTESSTNEVAKNLFTNSDYIFTVLLIHFFMFIITTILTIIILVKNIIRVVKLSKKNKEPTLVKQEQ